MKNNDWKFVLKSVAPSLSAALGGPMVGLAVQTLAQAIFSDKPAEEVKMPHLVSRLSEIMSGKVENSQTYLVALKKADREFTVKMRQLEINLEEIAQADRASARKRQAATGDLMPQILGGSVMVGFFVTVAYVLRGGLQDINADALTLIGTLIGYVSAKADQVIGYFFGSSSSSREKTRALARAVDGRRGEPMP